MKHMYRNIAIAGAIAVASSAVAFAHDGEPTYDRVSLSASAEREVENDLLIAVLFAEHQAQRQQTVSTKVNEAVRWALDRSKQRPGVKVQTTQYSTSPIYNKKVITGWRARQSIRLESKAPDKLSDLIGELQERMSIGAINYAVSKPTRDLAEEKLISEALAQFRRRAGLIAQDLGRKSYRIVQINVNTQGGRPTPIAYGARGVAAMERSAAPAIEAGVQKLTVNISGTIEVDADPM
ncbi:MAG: SIMPL domain-containing protein [Gammaproteobacteria bacterium]|nr:SIMPL domain-containing protein [Gammaproteobacteria bacterium]